MVSWPTTVTMIHLQVFQGPIRELERHVDECAKVRRIARKFRGVKFLCFYGLSLSAGILDLYMYCVSDNYCQLACKNRIVKNEFLQKFYPTNLFKSGYHSHNLPFTHK